MPMKQTTRKSILAPILPTVQQTVEVFQAAAQVAGSLAASPSEPAVPFPVRCRTKTTPNTRRVDYDKKMATQSHERAQVQGREERRKKFKNDKRPWTNTPKLPLPPKVKR